LKNLVDIYHKYTNTMESILYNFLNPLREQSGDKKKLLTTEEFEILSSKIPEICQIQRPLINVLEKRGYTQVPELNDVLDQLQSVIPHYEYMIENYDRLPSNL